MNSKYKTRVEFLTITCTTPFATSTSGIVTFAEFTNTLPPSTVMFTLPPPRVGSVMFLRPDEYPTVPFTTWYSRIWASCAVDREPTAEPMAWNAAFEGAKMVTSLRPSKAVTRFAVVRAPVSAVRLAALAVAESDSGRVRTVSMT